MIQIGDIEKLTNGQTDELDILRSHRVSFETKNEFPSSIRVRVSPQELNRSSAVIWKTQQSRTGNL
jgi:hypothetical protein